MLVPWREMAVSHSTRLPMKIFTLEETDPSPRTLKFIREFARTCRVIEMNGESCIYCLN